MRIISLVPVLVLANISMGAAASDWPQFLGPAGNSISSEKIANKGWNSTPPKKLWSVAMSDDGYAGPSVAAGKVFIVDHIGSDNVVKAINLQTGKDVWAYRFPDAAKANYGYVRATPVVNNGRVYVIGRFGEIICLNTSNGKKLWARNFAAEFKGKPPTWNYSMSPLIDGNKLILMPGGPNAAMVALDKVAGKTIWQGGGNDQASYATPAVAVLGGVRQYVAFTAVSIIGVDAEKGDLLWRVPWKTSYDINGAVAQITGNRVLLTSGYNHGSILLEIHGTNASTVWESKDMQARFNSPVLLNGHAYGIGEPGELSCVDLRTGKAIWKRAGFEFGGLIAVDGVLLAMNGGSGELVIVKASPDSYQELGKFTPLGGQSWTAPVLTNGNLIVRNKSTLACFSVK
ncbi:MAG: PQQ-binding-like beta-propeller repeat protein [Armatimonadota bacterium]